MAKTEETKTEEIKLVGAFVIDAETGNKMLNALGELPIKLRPIADPIIDGLINAHKIDLTFEVPVKE